MIKFIKRLFRKKLTYMYLINYRDYFTNRTHLMKVPSDKPLENQYPKMYGGIFSTITIIFIFEE